MEDTTGVYNSTTISYDNSGGVSMGGDGGGNGQRSSRPWNLSEIVSPPVARSRWFHWILLMGGSIFLGLGLIVVVIGIYNQHYYDPGNQNVKMDSDESPPSHWIITLIGFGIVLVGLGLLVIYCKMINTNHLLCNPLSRTRTALRQVVTKPRYHPGRQDSRGAHLLSNDGNNVNPTLTQYNPAPDLAFRQSNGEVTSEEKANLMANEMKEGIDEIPTSSCEALLLHGDSSNNGGTRSSHNSSSNNKDPRIVLHPFAKALIALKKLRASLSPQKSMMVESQTQTQPMEQAIEELVDSPLEGHVVIRPRSKSRSQPRSRAHTKSPPPQPQQPSSQSRHSPSPPPPQRPPRHKFSSLRRDLDPYPAALSSQQHYKPRHFSQHGYGVGKFPPALSSKDGNKAGPCPLASLEDITPSLRSSFASVMMYPPSDWGNSDESFDSTIMINLNSNHNEEGHENGDDNQDGSRDRDINKEFAVPDSQFDTKFGDFRISPARNVRKGSISSLSVQSALT